MATRFQYSRNGVEHGPVTALELKELAASGELGLTDLVRKEGSGDWVRASKVKGLFDGGANVVPAVVAPIVTPPAAMASAGEPPHASPAAAAPPPLSPGVAAAPVNTGAVGGFRQGLNELKEAARATAAQTQRVVEAGKDKLLERRLRQEAQAAQAQLGERLYKAGLGDPDLRARLARVDETILSQATAKTSTRAAADERLNLQLRLAEPYLDQSPAAGVEVEHEAVRKARQALRAHLASSGDRRSRILPSNSRDRVRVAAVVGGSLAAVGVITVVVVVGWYVLSHVLGGSAPTARDHRATPGGTSDDTGGTVVANEGGSPAAPDRGDAASSGAGSETVASDAVAEGSSAKQQAYQRMVEAEAAYKELFAAYQADHQRYQQERNNALGRRPIPGVPMPQVTMPDPELQLRMLQAEKEFKAAKQAYEQTP